jgi:WD40 repeat protein
VHVGHKNAIVAVTPRVAMHAVRPWNAPRPLALKSRATAVVADDAYLFVGSENGVVDVYDLETSAHVTTYSLSDATVSALCRLPSALLVVGTGVLDGRVFVVDVVDAKVRHRLEVQTEGFGVTALACDPRGRIVACGSDDATITILDPVKGKPLARLRVKETPTSMAFEASGRSLSCVFADGTGAIVTFGPKRASIDDLGVRGVSRVAWGDDLLFGFEDGTVQRIETAPS